RHPRTRRGRAEPRSPRPGEGPLDRREADVREGEEDPRLRADVCEEHGRGRVPRVARGSPRDEGDTEEARDQEGRSRPGVAMSVWAILVAAGRGERLGLDHPKAFAKLGEDPLLAEPLRRLDESGWVDAIVVVVPAGWEEPAILLAEELGCGKVSACVAGGEARADSVRAGLAEVPA